MGRVHFRFRNDVGGRAVLVQGAGVNGRDLKRLIARQTGLDPARLLLFSPSPLDLQTAGAALGDADAVLTDSRVHVKRTMGYAPCPLGTPATLATSPDAPPPPSDDAVAEAEFGPDCYTEVPTPPAVDERPPAVDRRPVDRRPAVDRPVDRPWGRPIKPAPTPLTPYQVAMVRELIAWQWLRWQQQMMAAMAATAATTARRPDPATRRPAAKRLRGPDVTRACPARRVRRRH
jgi:hypothetical protein